MFELAVCRMCLAVDARLYTIVYTPLQGVYERITNIPLQNEDKRPDKVCYLCHHLLRKYQAFMKKSVKADELLRHVLDRGIELTEANTRLMDTADGCSSFCVSHRDCIDLIPLEQSTTDHGSQEDVSTIVHVKNEPPDVKEEMEEIGIDITSECPENLEKISSPPRQWPHTNSTNTLLKESNVTEVVISHVKIEVESNTDMDSLDATPANKQKNNLQLSSQHSISVMCDFCSKVFNDEQSLKHHLQMHKADDNMLQHSTLIEEHTVEQQCLCEYCNAGLIYECILNKQTEQKQHLCIISYCNKAFNTKNHLKQHMLIHTGEKPHLCTYCNKAFSVKPKLDRHMLTHTGEKPHRCSYCNKAFSVTNNLNRHLLMHTEKPHRCSYCSKCFSDTHSLDKHTLKHTGGKPHRCGYCNKAFATRNHLHQHTLIHTKEKSHPCSHCDKAFSVKTKLNRHMLIHTGEKPHKCSQCSKAFTIKNNLTRHMLLHTRENCIDADTAIHTGQ